MEKKIIDAKIFKQFIEIMKFRKSAANIKAFEIDEDTGKMSNIEYFEDPDAPIEFDIDSNEIKNEKKCPFI